MPPASRITDLHSCPAHGGGPVSTGSPDTIIGYSPAARVSDVMVCAGPPDVIRQGASNVLINHLEAARIGDPTVHSGLLATGCPTVIIGETAQSGALVVAAGAAKPFVEECPLRRAEREAEEARRDAEAEGGGGQASEPPPPPENPFEPTPAERELAAATGNAPAQRSAREKVVRAFYEAHQADGLGQARADQDLGVGGVPPRANGAKIGFGIDLARPVKLVPFPPPEQLAMFVRKVGPAAGYLGNFIDPSEPPGSQTGDQLGLNDDPAFRKKVVLDVPLAGGVALQSGNGPILDDWTDPAKPRHTPGGGTQWTVPNSVKESLTCATCGAPRDALAKRLVAVGSAKIAPRRCTC